MLPEDPELVHNTQLSASNHELTAIPEIKMISLAFLCSANTWCTGLHAGKTCKHIPLNE